MEGGVSESVHKLQTVGAEIWSALSMHTNSVLGFLFVLVKHWRSISFLVFSASPQEHFQCLQYSVEINHCHFGQINISHN